MNRKLDVLSIKCLFAVDATGPQTIAAVFISDLKSRYTSCYTAAKFNVIHFSNL